VIFDKRRTVVENASAALPGLAREFFAAGAQAALPGASPKALHRFRLSVKRFRYTLELFERCYGPGLALRLDALRKLQQLLGDVSDCSATMDLLAERSDVPAAARERIEKRLRGMMRLRCAAFRSHWGREFSPPAAERSWIAYLGRPRTGLKRRRAQFN
jgi:CHAD domain-containing protein